MRRSSWLCVAAVVAGCGAFASCNYTASLDGYSVEYGFAGSGGGSGQGGMAGVGGQDPDGGGGTSQEGGGGDTSTSEDPDAQKPDVDTGLDTSLDGDAPDLPDQGNCTAGRVDCDGNESNGCEVDITNDPNHCGACKHSCAGGDCKSSTCQPFTLASGQAIPWGIAVDGTTVYWSNQGAGTEGEIRAVPIGGGTTKSLAANQGVPGDVAIDASHVYWTNYWGGGSVQRVSKSGTGITQISAANGPWGLVLDSTDVYWTNSNGSVRKAPIGGGSATPLLSSESDPRGITADANRIYWTAAGAGKIVRAEKDGTGRVELANGYSFPISIAIAGTTLYWANAGSYVLGSCNKVDGSIVRMAQGQPAEVLATAQACPVRIALDGDNVYWTNAGTYETAPNYDYNGAVMKRALTGGTPVAVASGPGVISPYGLAVDNNHVYWTTQGLGPTSGAVMRVVKK